MSLTCRGCWRDIVPGDKVRKVENNEGLAVYGEKSGRTLIMELDDPATTVWVHAACVVEYMDPKSNEGFMRDVEELQKPQWKEEWNELEKDRVVAEALEHSEKICASCYEEIKFMSED